MASVVRLNGVTKRFGRLEAVRNLSLEVEEGEFLTLLGPSGCGKTTTLRMISGFEVPDEGEVYIGGEVVNHLPPFRRNVNTVFQNYALFPHLTVFENVAYSLTVRRVKKADIGARVADMLDRVGLADKARSMPRELSGGQMQRVALARALINEPRLLLLDEPLGALDAKLRRAMQLELKHMQANLGITFIYVTHDQEEALVMSNRVAVLDSGMLQQLGSPTQIFERPANRFVADFIGTANFFEGVVVETTATGCRIAVTNGDSFEVATALPVTNGDRVTATVRPQKVKVARDTGAAPADVNLLPGTLKEVIYEGAMVRLVMTLPGGETVEAQNIPENLPFAYDELRPGDRLSIHLPPDAILVYPE